ncbi:MAG: hypothetical protein PWQ12_1850 [Clostridiales bacterium]|nr:hypothetical protein [Clostridiales bacterium]
MKKIIFITALLLAGILLTRYEIALVAQEKAVHLTEVVAVSKDIEAGTVIELSQLQLVQIDESLWSDGYFKTVEEVAGKTLRTSLSKNALVTRDQLKESSFDTPSTGNAVTALQLDPEAALCWTVSKGECVEVVHVNEAGYKVMGVVTVIGLFDQTLLESRTPEYLLVEGPELTIEAIVRSRDDGRMEIVKYSGN